LVADDAQTREEALRQLIRIGFDELRGYVDGGMASWEAEGFPIARVPIISVEELHHEHESGGAPEVLDVRQDAEWRAGHLAGARHAEGGRLSNVGLSFPEDEPLVVHCGHADRSTVAISLLEQRGYHHLTLLYGGMSAWQSAGYPVTREG
jgi:hydroxyacylglutathione hydrolase